MWLVAAHDADYRQHYGDYGSGTLVVVERTGSEGIERSAKEIHFFFDRYELRPRSSNPEHQPIIVAHASRPHPEIQIIGVVLSAHWDLSPVAMR